MEYAAFGIWLFSVSIMHLRFVCIVSVQFSRSLVADSLRPHGLQHTRLPCLSPTPGACSNSCPSSRWCHPPISSSVIPFSSCLQSFPASRSFPMSQLFTSYQLIILLYWWIGFTCWWIFEFFPDFDNYKGVLWTYRIPSERDCWVVQSMLNFIGSCPSVDVSNCCKFCFPPATPRSCCFSWSSPTHGVVCLSLLLWIIFKTM